MYAICSKLSRHLFNLMRATSSIEVYAMCRFCSVTTKYNSMNLLNYQHIRRCLYSYIYIDVYRLFVCFQVMTLQIESIGLVVGSLSIIHSTLLLLLSTYLHSNSQSEHMCQFQIQLKFYSDNDWVSNRTNEDNDLDKMYIYK